jgi:hypothetical protein
MVEYATCKKLPTAVTQPYSTKGILFQIGPADRFSRETLEKRLEETPSNARCFAQGSSLMC